MCVRQGQIKSSFFEEFIFYVQSLFSANNLDAFILRLSNINILHLQKITLATRTEGAAGDNRTLFGTNLRAIF